MIAGPLSASEPEKISPDLLISPVTLPLTGNILKPKWLAKIAARRQLASSLVHKTLAADASNESNLSPSESSPAFTILDPLKMQQNNLFHVISNLILFPLFSSQEMPETQLAKNISKPDLIEWLKEKGFLSLAEKMEFQTGYPWNEFKKIRSPILIEQLVDIYLLCRHKKVSEDNTNKLVNFALHFAQIASSPNFTREYHNSYEILNDTQQMLGQLIYLINQDPNYGIQAIETPHYQLAVENIKDAFNDKIQDICERLQSHYLLHLQAPLQNPEIALHTRIPFEVAKALLTDIGTINFGIIDTLSDIFLSTDSKPINHEINLAHALALLHRSPRLRAEFEKINSPASPTTPSNSVIRIALGLPPEYPINSFECRLTALIAILSHLRQGEDRSCFAVSLAIEILSSHLGFCFKDLRQVLEDGKLTRCVKGVEKDIPFIKKINDENLHKSIDISRKGNLVINLENKAPLWEAPGILAACHSIGIIDAKEAILDTLSQFTFNKDGLFKVEIKILLQKICEQVLINKYKDSEKPSLDHLYTQASFAFSSQTSQALLKVWENAIANMAEAEEGSMIKTSILTTILDALQYKLGELKIPPSLTLQRFFLHIQKSLYERIRLQYDPTIISSKEGGTHSAGGFFLLDQTNKIEDEKSFKLFLFNILQEIKNRMLLNSSTEIEKFQLNQVYGILSTHLESKEFIAYLLARYHPSNKLAISQMARGRPLDYSTVQSTPWLTRMGNDSKALLKIFFEYEKPIQTEKFIVSGAEEALTKIIEMCKRMSEEERQLYLKNPNKLKPLCILGKHRLPFMAGNPSLANAWQQEYSTQVWIEKFVLAPGKKIAETVIDAETKSQFIQRLQNDIVNIYIPKTKINTVLDLIKQIPSDSLIKQYRGKILNILQSHSQPSTVIIDKLTRQIDTALSQSLEPHLKKILEDSAVHFADTNWCEGIQDLHLCFAVNPGTGELELWEAQANGSHLMALDQNYWLFNQKWEFLTIPEDLIPDDSCYLSDS